MTLDLEKMARPVATEWVYTVSMWHGRSPEFMQAQVNQLTNKLLEFARSVQKATEEHWVNAVDAEHKEWAAQLEGEPVNVWEALDNVRQAGLRLLAEEEG